jgi:hypothetical protein
MDDTLIATSNGSLGIKKKKSVPVHEVRSSMDISFKSEHTTVLLNSKKINVR